MAALSLDHVSVATRDLDRSLRFYRDVIGLRVGPRPQIDFPGAWLYDDDRAVVHLIAKDHAGKGGGAVDHVAFNADGHQQYRERLDRLGIAYESNYIKDVKLAQLFIRDPDGVTIELNFRDD